MIIPDGMRQAYLSQNSIKSRLALLEGRIDPRNGHLEQVLDLSLEAAWLFGNTPLPADLQAALMSLLDGLSGPLAVRVSSPNAEPEGMFLEAPSSRAAVMETVRAGWARAWTPSALLERFSRATADKIEPVAWPRVEVLEQAILDPAERASTGKHIEHTPDGTLLELAPKALRAALDEETTNSDHERIAVLALYTRYCLGLTFNALAQPADPFGFLDLLLPGLQSSEPMRRSYDSLCRAAGLNGELEYVELAERLMELETDAAGNHAMEPEPAPEPDAGNVRAVSLEPQQLIGSPSSPGRAAGTLRHGPAPYPDGTVLACQRFSRDLAAGRPVAVLERGGGRIGTGALLARAASLPCASGIVDLALLPAGTAVMVDGGLGLVTVQHQAARSSQ